MVNSNEKKELPRGITLRQDGLYMGRFQYDGETYALYDRNLRTLKTKLSELRYEVEHGLYSKESNISVATWFDAWIKEYKETTVKKGTVGTYRDNFDFYIKKTLGHKKLKEVRPEHIQKFYNDMHRRGYARSTIEVSSVILGGLFKQAFKNGMIIKNPVPLATLPKNLGNEERRVLTKQEQNIFLKYAKETKIGYIYELALSTGMRSGELRGLKWGNIDYKNHVIHVTGTLVQNRYGFYIDTPKTLSSVRDIPMLPNVESLLKTRYKEQKEEQLYAGQYWEPLPGLDGLVATMEDGHPVSKNYMNVLINKVVKRINGMDIKFDHMSSHTLRHTFATRCMEQGMSPETLMHILGHGRISQTMDLYVHVLADTKAEEMKKIANLF